MVVKTLKFIVKSGQTYDSNIIHEVSADDLPPSSASINGINKQEFSQEGREFKESEEDVHTKVDEALFLEHTASTESERQAAHVKVDEAITEEQEAILREQEAALLKEQESVKKPEIKKQIKKKRIIRSKRI